MSLYPCEFCKARVPGALESVRLTALSDNAPYSRRMRLCPAHLNELVQVELGKWDVVGAELSNSADVLCAACGGGLENGSRGYAVFAWIWRRGADAEERYATYCYGDGERLINNYGLNQQPLPNQLDRF